MHAREKHKYFCDRVGSNERTQKELDGKYASFLSRIRAYIAEACRSGTLCWVDLLDCELGEAFEALAAGNGEQAVEELYDSIAVLLRTIDVLEGRQPLGKPISGNPAGKTHKEKTTNAKIHKMPHRQS